jgi:hypothetical protein
MARRLHDQLVIEQQQRRVRRGDQRKRKIVEDLWMDGRDIRQKSPLSKGAGGFR